MLRLLCLSLVLLLGSGLAAQTRLEASARFVPETANPGQEVTLEVSLEVVPGYHIYGSLQDPELGSPTTLEILEDGGLKAKGDAGIPGGEPHELAGMETFNLYGKVVLTQTFEVPAGLSGKIEVEALVAYMACDETSCDPPASIEVKASLMVEAAAEAPVAAEPVFDPDFALPGLPGFGNEPKLSMTARVEPNPARAGETVRVVLEVEMDPNWHIYGALDEDPSTVRFTQTSGLSPQGALSLPEGKRHEIADIAVNYWLEESFEISQFLKVPEDAKAGTLSIEGALDYLPCNPVSCLNPSEETFALKLEIEAGPAREANLLSFAAAPDEDDPSEGSGLLGLILAAIGGGLFALMMPCTYPMIPITISFFTKQAADRGGRVLPLALAYGGGIILMFIAIGLFVGPAILAFASHWVTNVVIGSLFIIFALSLFGMITLQAPQFMNQLSSKAATTGGLLGVFLMGATLVISSFTCSAPVIGTFLSVFSTGESAYISKWVDLALGMGVFGATMALPFVFLSLMPGRVKSMPKSGEWMNVLKVFLGFVEIAAAMKFFSNAEYVWELGLLPRELFLLLWFGLFMVAGVYLLGLFRLKDDSPANIGPGRLVSALGAILFALYCLFGAQGYQLDTVMSAIAPPYSADMVSGNGTKVGQASSAHEIIKDDYAAALAKAKATGKKVLVNFTGFT